MPCQVRRQAPSSRAIYVPCFESYDMFGLFIVIIDMR